MSSLDAKTVNELFLRKLDSPEDLTKLAQEGATFIRTRLRENSFARKVVNPEYVTKADLQRSVDHDQLVKIVDIEPDSTAMQLNLRAQPTANYVEGQRFELSFYNISSEDFQKTEEELLSYEMPLTEVIERNSVKDIQEIEDTGFLTLSNASAIAANNTVTGNYAAGTGEIPKQSFKDLFDQLDGARLKADVILMDTVTFNRLFLPNATTFGDQVGQTTYVNGYTYSTLLGRKLVVSNKVSLFTPTTGTSYIYAFTSQEYFAKFYILNDTRFWIEKRKNLISWSAYETIAMGVGNNNGVARLAMS